MIKFYGLDVNNKIEETKEHSKGCWVNMISPSVIEINKISELLNVPIDFFKDSLDHEERSRIEKEDDNVLVIIDFPYMTLDDHGHTLYETMPLGILLTDNYVVTVSSMECPFLVDIINNKLKGVEPAKKTRFTLQILYMISNYYLRYLKQIDRRTNDVEKELRKSLKNKELYALMALEKSLVYFSTSLRSNKIVLEKLLRLHYIKMYDDDKELLEDVLIDIAQAIEMVEIYSSITSGMRNAFASIISNNLNIVMKVLASITIVISFPTIVSSFFGMNVPLPFGLGENPNGFMIAMIISFILSGAAAFWFWRKKFF